MDERIENRVQCPYCWERIEVLVDPSDVNQSYIEDCEVCCRPIEISVHEDADGTLSLSVRRDDDVE